LIDFNLIAKNNIDLKQYCKFLNSLNVPIAQYRDKSKNFAQIKQNLELIKANFNGKLIINDYIALIEFADGLHLGQEDLNAINSDFKEAIKSIKGQIGNKILGLSTHNLEEIKVANSLNLDYIGLGAYRDTATKKSVTIGGKELLEIAKVSKHPVAIIGGVKLSDSFESFIAYRVIGSDLIRAFLNKNV